MMRLILVPALGAVTMLAACGQQYEEAATEEVAAPADEAAPAAEFGFAEAMEQGGPTLPALAPPNSGADGAVVERLQPAGRGRNGEAQQGEIPVVMPQIAYSYDYGFRVDSDVLGPLQQQHADFCVSKGPNVCRIISMQQAGSSGEYGHGELHIEVVADKARDFGKQLVGAAEKAGGEQIASSIRGEDLSKQIVDTEARLRARTLLRDRLMEVLATRRGTVAELVEAERGVAQVNEEIDQASSWLAEMKGRVAFSDMAISYETEDRSAGGFWEPIRWALGSIGETLGLAIAAIIRILTILLPWGLVLLGISWVWRRMGLPWFHWSLRRKKAAQDEAPTESPPQ